MSSSFANHHANSNIMWDSSQLDNTVLCLMSGRTHSYSGRHTNQLVTKQCVVKCKKNVHRATLLFLDIICKRVANKNSMITFPFLCLLYQLVANAVLFVCVNCVGVFHLWMTEHDLRISNQKREEFSAIRSRKEIKKYQQVKEIP